jgi:hypothetical protein
MDEQFALPGDPLAARIRENLRTADFVAVFLSPHSVASPWVAREILETVLLELETRLSTLIPCVLESCQLPEIFGRRRTDERLYIDFGDDEADALGALLNRTREEKTPIFTEESYSVLNIPVPELQIYLTGETWDWRRSSPLKYDETIDRYLLFGFDKQSGTLFKHFVLCDQTEAERVKAALQNAGYLVTGRGSRDLETGQRRVWFLDPHYPIEDEEDNRWL